MNKEGTIYTIIFIFIVSFVFVFLLSLTNQQTIALVQLNQELVRQGAVLSAMGIKADSPDQIQQKYASVGADVQDGLYVANVSGNFIYAIRVAGPGLWGTIEGILAVTADLSEIVGIEILSDTETPGLGGRINEAWFKNQFRGERVTGGTITVRQVPGEGDTDHSNGIIDGITGATRTSDSMQAIVNGGLRALRSNEIGDKLKQLAGEAKRE